MDKEIEKVIEKIKKEKDFFIKAKLLKFLRTKKDIPLKGLAKALDLKPAYICHILRLNRLPDMVVDGYYSKHVSISHLFILSRLKDKEKLISIYEQVLIQGLTVSQTEVRVREALHGIKTEGEYITSEEKKRLSDLLRAITERIKVEVIQTRVKAKIVIEIKGSALETSEVLRKIAKKISSG